MASITGTDEFSQSTSDAVNKLLKEVHGVQILTQQKFSPGDTDFTSQLLAIRQTNADLIHLSALYVEASRIIRQARELGLKLPITGTPSMMNSGLIAVAGPAAEGVTTGYVARFFNGDPARDMVEFEARYKKMYPRYPVDRPNFVDMYAYGSMYALAEGMRRAGKDLTRKGLVDALETMREFMPSSSWPRALDVVQPLSFADSHNGNRRLIYFRVSGGAFRTIGEYKAPMPSSQFPAGASLAW